MSMTKVGQMLAFSLAAMLMVSASASVAFATHKEGHHEPPACDNGNPAVEEHNKHCVADEPPAPVQPTQTTPPPGVGAGGGGAGGGGNGGGGGVAPVPDAVITDTLPFTGFNVSQAVVLLSLLLGLGGFALALGKRRAAKIEERAPR
jgi:hypothetical protein